MGRKDDHKPVMGINACDPEQVRMTFLAMRTRMAQAVARADKSIRECHKLESHLNLLNMKMQLSRASLIALQLEMDRVIKGLEDARQAELRELN